MPRKLSASRFVLSTLGWLFFLTALVLLVRSLDQVMNQGGFCASGGPYQITSQCSDKVILFGSITPWILIAAVFFQGGLAKGWGPSLPLLFWSALFCTLGGTFIHGASKDSYSATAGYAVGSMFMLMGGLPLLAIVIRGYRQALSLVPPSDRVISSTVSMVIGSNTNATPTKANLFAQPFLNVVAGVAYLGAVIVVSIALAGWLWQL